MNGLIWEKSKNEKQDSVEYFEEKITSQKRDKNMF